MIAYRVGRHALQPGTGLHLFRISIWWSDDTTLPVMLFHEALLPVGERTVTVYDDDGFLRRTAAGFWLPRVRINDAGDWEQIPAPGHPDDPWSTTETTVDRAGDLVRVLDAIVVSLVDASVVGVDVIDDPTDLVASDDRWADLDALVGVVRTLPTDTEQPL